MSRPLFISQIRLAACSWYWLKEVCSKCIVLEHMFLHALYCLQLLKKLSLVGTLEISMNSDLACSLPFRKSPWWKNIDYNKILKSVALGLHASNRLARNIGQRKRTLHKNKRLLTSFRPFPVLGMSTNQQAHPTLLTAFGIITFLMCETSRLLYLRIAVGHAEVSWGYGSLSWLAEHNSMINCPFSWLHFSIRWFITTSLGNLKSHVIGTNIGLVFFTPTYLFSVQCSVVCSV